MQKLQPQTVQGQVPGAVPLPAPKAPAKARKAPATLASYTAGPTPVKARKGTWRAYMLGCILKASNVDDANKAHAKAARRAGFSPSAKLDYKWAVQQGYIVPAK